MVKKIFLSGLKAFIPIALTVAIMIWLFITLETFFGHVLKQFVPPQYYFPGLGILFAVAIIFFLGIVVNAWIIRRIYRFAENIVKKIPVVKTVYMATKDFISYFDKDQQKAQQTVLVTTEIGQIIGLITRDELEKLKLGIETKGKVMVYIPFSYTIGGLTVMMPKKDVTPIDMPVDKAMSLIITAAMVGNK